MKEIDCTILEKMYEEKTKDYKDRIYEEDEKLQVLAENSMESLVLLLDDIKARKIIRSYIQEWKYVSFLYYELRCIKWNRK
ncbi:MAG: hypothetical protein MR458_05300 [Erysipelotrichaceae bacterium]|nr:hypothetical protein [Erysipelotrichaceae bacterium]